MFFIVTLTMDRRLFSFYTPQLVSLLQMTVWLLKKKSIITILPTLSVNIRPHPRYQSFVACAL
jgi:hypothetical protein